MPNNTVPWWSEDSFPNIPTRSRAGDYMLDRETLRMLDPRRIAGRWATMPPPDAKRPGRGNPGPSQESLAGDDSHDSSDSKPESAYMAWRRERLAAKRAAEVAS